MNELDLASHKALKDYMGLASTESLLIVTDGTKDEISRSLLKAGKELCRDAFLIEMKPGEINGQEPPAPVAQLMKMVDVVICPTDKSLTHTRARIEAAAAGVRVATMPGISKETMVRCLNADYKKVIDLTRFIAGKLNKASAIRIVTEKGTLITMPMKGRKVLKSTGVLRNRGESGNLPSGEVYLAPWEGKTNGIVVIDGSMAGLGMLKSPLTIEVINGYAEHIEGEDAHKLADLLDQSGREARAVAEFGMGTNYLAKLIGEILEDEKVFGTIHIAFGNNKSMGGIIDVKSHLDGLVNEPDVYFDDELIMKKGKLLNYSEQ